MPVSSIRGPDKRLSLTGHVTRTMGQLWSRKVSKRHPGELSEMPTYSIEVELIPDGITIELVH